MDFSVGAALWFAARGEGTIWNPASPTRHGERYRSVARVVLQGSGPDEMLAGYRRHRHAFAAGGKDGLRTELERGIYHTILLKFLCIPHNPPPSPVRPTAACKPHPPHPPMHPSLDWLHHWGRNLGRDDRCVCVHGRESRYPYLDEDVVAFIRSLPDSALADLSLPDGVGDKLLLVSDRASGWVGE